MSDQQVPKVCFLIDDDPDDQEIFSLALEKITPRVTCEIASDCQEALGMLAPERKFIPDYIFLDLNMPRMNGKQCLKEIRRHPHLNSVPVIMYSTSLIDSDIFELRQLGAMDFLTKPNNISTLSRVLSNFFKTNKLSAISSDHD